MKIGRVLGRAMLCSAFGLIWGMGAAQYVGIVLQQSTYGSHALAAYRGTQVGYSPAVFGLPTHALLWHGPGVATEMEPAGYYGSAINDVWGTKQAGWARKPATQSVHAILWNGSASDFVDLHPSAFAQSQCNGMSESHQIGVVYASNGDQMRAVMWTGTASSVVVLHPSWAVRSVGMGIHNGRQVGYGYDTSGWQRATLWQGTAASCVNLHPNGELTSQAIAVWDNEQVGFTGPSVDARAALWNGTAASYTNMHPVGAEYSRLNDVCNGTQVGSAHVPTILGNREHAHVWHGVPGSAVDVHEFLPPEFSRSRINGIAPDGTLVGIADVEGGVGWVQPVMWIPVPVSLAPSSYALVHGIPRGGSLASLVASDDDRLRSRMNFETSRLAPKVILELAFDSPWQWISRLNIEVEASVTLQPIVQTVSLWNGAAWVEVDSSPATLADSVRSLSWAAGASGFVVGGKIRVRLQFYTFDRENLSRAEALVDRVRLTVYP